MLSYTLTGNGTRVNNHYSIILSTYDSNRIRQLTELATSTSNVFLSVTNEAFADVGNNTIIEIPNMASLTPSNVTDDITAPEI